MKILAGVRGHPLFKCMLDIILSNVKNRFSGRYALNITGPAVLQRCYSMNNMHGLDVTYRDTRNAMWPYAGMTGAAGLLAFEIPSPAHFDVGDVVNDDSLRSFHYDNLLSKGVTYTSSCEL